MPWSRPGSCGAEYSGALADREVEEAVATELDVAAVVVPTGAELGRVHQDALGTGIDDVRRRQHEPRETVHRLDGPARAVLRIRVVQVDVLVGRELLMHGDAAHSRSTSVQTLADKLSAGVGSNAPFWMTRS